MSFNYKNPISPLTALGTVSLSRTEVYGTNFSVLSTGGFMEVYSINDLYFTIPSGSTGLIEFTGNTIPIQFQKGTGNIFSPDVLTLNSDNISSGRRRLGMLVYVIDEDQIYQYQIPNFLSLWTGATSASGPGGPTVVMSDFGTTIKSNSPEGVAFISAWTANTIEGISGETSTTAVWKKLVLGAVGEFLSLSGGTVTGDTIFTSGLTANTFSASTYLGLPLDIFVTGGTYSAGTATFTNNTGGTFDVTGLISADTYTTGFTFNVATYDLTIKRNDGVDLTQNLSILASDVTITGGTYDPNTGTATFTNNTGGTFNVTGFITGFTDIYVTGGTFDKNSETLTLNRNDGNDVTITGFTDVYVTGGSYSAGTITFTNNSGATFDVSGLFTGATDVFVTGGTYSAGTATFTNNTGGTFDVLGFYTGGTDYYVTGGTFDKNTETLTLNRNDGNDVQITGFTDIYVTGGTYSAGTATFTNNSGVTFDITGFYTGATDVFVTGGTYSAGTATFTNNTGGTFNVTGFSSVANDVFVTGFTLSNDQLILTQNSYDVYSSFTVNLSAFSGNELSYYVSASTPTGVTLKSGDRWFNTNTGVELVWINDGDSSQWIQPFSVPGPISPDVGYYSTTGISTSQTITWDKTYWGISASTNVDLTLPSTTAKEGYYLIIKDELGTCGIYRIRLTPSSGTIDGNNYIDMNINFMSLTCMVRNGNWFLI